ncbi:DUF3140 domain-containing protein [Aquipuribacter hungaricus]|uniref:DUF3140 domain-containing protein n=1 Tax=Aquipuribacter hungaricus TaxID=545624 RepID=A0ABV7WID3_9MICO
MSDAPEGLDEAYERFEEAVTMSPKQLRDWLETEESQSVGQHTDGDDEATGHAMGRRILELKETKKADYSDDDVAAMKKVAGYVARHSAQRPDGDVTDTAWRYSLVNWGHDPLA